MLVLMAQFLTACLHHVEHRSGTRLRDVDSDATMLKAHLRNGELLLLTQWKETPETGALTGIGQRWNAARELVADGTHVVPLHEVAVFETNSRRSSIGPNITFGVLSAVSTVVVVAFTAFAILFVYDS